MFCVQICECSCDLTANHSNVFKSHIHACIYVGMCVCECVYVVVCACNCVCVSVCVC